VYKIPQFAVQFDAPLVVRAFHFLERTFSEAHLPAGFLKAGRPLKKSLMYCVTAVLTPQNSM
jgi:hypothetical protein